MSQDLIKYISNELKKGKSREAISNSLSLNGWEQSKIDEVFAQLSTQQTITPDNQNLESSTPGRDPIHSSAQERDIGPTPSGVIGQEPETAIGTSNSPENTGSEVKFNLRKKALFFVIIPILSLIVFSLGFGVFNALTTRSYANFVKETWENHYTETTKHATAIKEDWNAFNNDYAALRARFEAMEEINPEEVNKEIDEMIIILEELKDGTQKMEATSSEAMDALNARNAPYKGEAIKKEAVSYFESLNSISIEATKFAELSLEYLRISKTTNDAKVYFSPGSDPATLISAFRSYKELMDEVVKKMEGMTVLENLLWIHNNYIEAFESYSEATGLLVRSHDSSDFNGMMTAITDLDTAREKYLKALEDGHKQSEVMLKRFTQESERGGDIQQKINDFVSKFQNKILVY